MNTGLSDRDMNTLNAIFKKYPQIKLVHLFGSRAMGNYKKGSDIDLAIMNSPIDDTSILRILSDFEESSLPYFVDIVDYDHLNEAALKQHIERVGKKIYEAALTLQS